MRRSLRMRLWVVTLCLLIMLPICANAADESVQVSIPVIAFGHDCSVGLYDASGNRVQLLHVTDGVESSFVIELNGLKTFTYRAMVIDEHSDTVIYDRRNYLITIAVVMGPDEKPTALVYVESIYSGVGKYGRLEFNNTLIVPPPPTPTPTPTVTPTPVVTPTPTPVPTATPAPYDELFSFRKVWSGDYEDSINWVMYNANGTVRHKLFDKYVISDYEWHYEAYFQDDVSDCYVIEYPIEGYQAIYQNVGKYSDVTDRCHNGGTIINYKLPSTGDETPIANYTALIVISLLGACLLMVIYRRQLMGKKS